MTKKDKDFLEIQYLTQPNDSVERTNELLEMLVLNTASIIDLLKERIR